MKGLILLALCAFAAASIEVDQVQFVDSPAPLEDSQALVIDEPVEAVENEVALLEDAEVSGNRNFLLSALIRQLFNFLRIIIINGNEAWGIPPLDPLSVSEYHLNIPAGIINLALELFNVHATGFSGFRVHKSEFKPKQLTFDLEISVPHIDISSDSYILDGDFFTAIPLYGKGDSHFEIKNFKFRGLLHLKQSEDGKSVLIDRVENASFELPHFQSKLSGVIGGGDIDQIVNLMLNEVIVDYVNRFQGIIAKVTSDAIVKFGNPVLETLDTWAFIRPFV